MNYLQEAKNTEILGRNLEGFDRLVVPRPIASYTTTRALTMEFMSGRKITSVSPLRRTELDGHVLAAQLLQAYLKQVLVDGLFHADPHPGNLFLTDDDRSALLDPGMVGRVPPNLQDTLLRLLLAISSGDGARAGEIAVDVGEPLPSFDRESFLKATAALVARYQDALAEDIQMGRVVLSVTRSAGQHGIRVPSALTLLGKALLNLDHVGSILDSQFDPNAAVRTHAAGILERRLLEEMKPGNVFRAALEVNEFVQQLPGRLNRFLDRVSRDEVELKIDAFDEVHMMEGLQEIANRITIGLVLAALIVGAALLVQVDTDFTILGYPGLAILLFLGAAAAGVVLLFDIILHDEKVKRK